MNAARLLEYFDRIAEAPDAVSRLRKFILDLAVRGKLVEQDPSDEPTSELVSRIKSETDCRKRGGKFKEPTTALSFDIDELPFSVPKTWSWVRFIELAEVGYGFAFDSNCFNSERRGIPLIRIRDISNKDTEAYYEGEYQDLYITCPGDILVGMDGDFNVRIWSGPLGLLNQRVMRVRNWLCGLNRDYIAIPLQAILNYLHQGTSLTTVKHLSAKQVNGILIPLPPLAEQHRIVAKVDELMTLCDRLEASQAKRESRRDRLASASLKRIGQPEDVGNGEELRENVRFHLHHLPRLATRPEHVKELRQTILNLAVRGKLVPQDPSDEPASELLKKIRLEKVKLISSKKLLKVDLEDTTDKKNGPFKLPIGWAWARFPELGILGRGKSKHRPRNDVVLFDGGTHYFIQTGDVARSNGVIKTYTSKYNEIGLAQSAKWPTGTLCITIAANIADSGILSFDACFPDSVVGFIPARVYDNARYFEYFVRTAKADLLEFAPATAQKNINLNILNSVLIPLPPLAEQHRIVAKVDELMTICDKLEVHLATNQKNQSRLLEATLCDALGVTCLPVSRPSRPAPPLKRGVAAHSDLPFKPIVPRPVEAPKPMVQGSLVEQPTPKVENPHVTSGDIPSAILAQMQPGQEYSRAQLTETLGLSVSRWNMAIRELKESGRVVQAGERRGARYRIN